MSKAQVTLFIILGIVILFFFFFVFYITETAHEKRLEAKIEKPIADFLKSKTINYYVVTCLDKKSKEALTLIGNQGGFIYDKLINWNIPYVDYKGKKVAYQIYSDLSGKLREKNPAIYNPPYYPCFTKAPNPAWVGEDCYLTYDHNKKQYMFGKTGDPKNNINPDLCKETITTTGYSCTCSDPLNCKYSIQSQLEDYIQKEVKKCIDFSSIKEYDITTGDIIANVTFGSNNVLFQIDFPITIKVKGSEPIIKVLHFSLPQQIRFKTIYNLAKALIEKDTDDIAFDIVRDGQDLATEKKYGDIKIIRDNIFPNASIIIIEDNKSKIDGEKYVFMFARENRNPALDYMKFDEFKDYDLYIIENQTLNFTPIAYDPDEDGITKNLLYDYTDWYPIDKQLELSRIYKSPEDHECIHPFSETSEQGRCATYDLRKSDIGPHKLTIKFQDSERLYDYQKINILVDDIPNINLELNNTYLDIDNNFASIEDPFIFDASKTKDEWPKPVVLLFKWEHTKPDNNFGFNYDWGDIKKVYLPNQNPDINDMDGYFDSTGIHNIKLEVKNQQITPLENIATNLSQIIVTECLPHRNVQGHASYPFNNIDWDDYGYKGTVVDNFQGDHTCCKDDGTYEPSNKICYELIDYGCFVDFTDPNSEYYNPGGAITGLTPIIDYKEHSTDQQQVYKRTLIRKCSSNRGNICNGVVETYKIEWDHTCTGYPTPRRCVHSTSSGAACKY